MNKPGLLAALSALTDLVLLRGRVRSESQGAGKSFFRPLWSHRDGLSVLSGKVRRLFSRPRRAVRTQA